MVKRIVGTPGEIVAAHRGTVTIDGAPLAEPYVQTSEHGIGSFPPVALGPDQYFVMGDNRVMSCDSRHFGAIPRSAIRGKVILVTNKPLPLLS